MRRRASFSTRCKWRLVTICFKGGEGREREEGVKLKTKPKTSFTICALIKKFRMQGNNYTWLKVGDGLATGYRDACCMSTKFTPIRKWEWRGVAYKAAAARHVNCRGTSLSGAAYPSTAEATFVFRLVFSRSFSRIRSVSLLFALSLSCSFVAAFRV